MPRNGLLVVMTDLQDYMLIPTGAGTTTYVCSDVYLICLACIILGTRYHQAVLASMCVCTAAACGMGLMRQQLHLDHDEIMELNIFTNIDNEQFLFRTCMQTNIDEIIVQ